MSSTGSAVETMLTPWAPPAAARMSVPSSGEAPAAVELRREHCDDVRIRPGGDLEERGLGALRPGKGLVARRAARSRPREGRAPRAPSRRRRSGRTACPWAGSAQARPASPPRSSPAPRCRRTRGPGRRRSRVTRARLASATRARSSRHRVPGDDPVEVGPGRQACRRRGPSRPPGARRRTRRRPPRLRSG